MPEGLILPRAEALIRETGVAFRIGGDRAYYDTVKDYVRVPPPRRPTGGAAGRWCT